MQETMGKLFKNRSGAVIAGVIVAVIAVVLLLLYLRSYRSSVNSGKQPERVLVATKNIPAGTSGKLIAQKQLYTVATVQKDQLELNAITDPSALRAGCRRGHFPWTAADADRLLDRGAAVAPLPAHRPAARDRGQRERQPRARGSGRRRRHGRHLYGNERPGRYFEEDRKGTSERAARHPLHAQCLVLVAPGSGPGGSTVLRINTRDAAKFAIRPTARPSGSCFGRLSALHDAAVNGYPGNSACRSSVGEAVDGGSDQDLCRSRRRCESGRSRALASEERRSRDRRHRQRHRRCLGQASRDLERPAARSVLGSVGAGSQPDRQRRHGTPTAPGRRTLLRSPNGFTRRVFAAGADDVVMLPVTPDEVLFALQKALAVRRAPVRSARFPVRRSFAFSARRAVPARR